MAAGNPKGQGPSAEARARSAATRRREADNRLAEKLIGGGWLPIRPEMLADLWGRDPEYIGCVILEQMKHLREI